MDATISVWPFITWQWNFTQICICFKCPTERIGKWGAWCLCKINTLQHPFQKTHFQRFKGHPAAVIFYFWQKRGKGSWLAATICKMCSCVLKMWGFFKSRDTFPIFRITQQSRLQCKGQCIQHIWKKSCSTLNQPWLLDFTHCVRFCVLSLLFIQNTLPKTLLY